MKLLTGYACLLAVLCMAVPAAAQPRQPTAKWVLSTADGQCTAGRLYGSAVDPISLIIKPFPLGKVIELSLLVKGTAPVVPKEKKATIRFDEGQPLSASLLIYPVENRTSKALRINLAAEDFAPVRAAKTLWIQSEGYIDEGFILGPMDKLMAAVDRCLVDIQAYWNIGDETRAALRKRAEPKASLAAYVSSDDYPGDSVLKRSTGTVGFALLINEAGKVVECVVTETSNVPFLDAQTCAIMHARTRFDPAVGADGKPARDIHKGQIRWVMGRDTSGATRID